MSFVGARKQLSRGAEIADEVLSWDGSTDPRANRLIEALSLLCTGTAEMARSLGELDRKLTRIEERVNRIS